MNSLFKIPGRFYLITLLVFTSRAFDMVTTFFYTKDLSKEGNPVMKYLGWRGSLPFQIIICLIVSYFAYHYYKSIDKIHKEELFDRNIPFSRFVPLYQYNTAKGFIINLLTKFPEKRISKYFLGYILPRILIFSGFLVGTSTSILLNYPKYTTFYVLFKIPLIFIFLILISGVYYYYQFHKIEYRKYIR